MAKPGLELRTTRGDGMIEVNTIEGNFAFLTIAGPTLRVMNLEIDCWATVTDTESGARSAHDAMVARLDEALLRQLETEP